MRKIWSLLAFTIAAIASLALPATATAPPIQHVLLISVDGLHAVDVAKYVAAHPNSAFASFVKHGVTFTQASTTNPSDSFPGLLAQLTGGTPNSTGVFYDDSFDRTLSPPLAGPLAGPCPNGGAGTEVLYDETADIDLTRLDGGGGINTSFLPRDPNNGCMPVFPHSFVRVNNIFEVAKSAGLRTAWSDKHQSYDLVRGPSGAGVDDLYVPEVDSNAFGPGSTGGIWTDSVPNIEIYDRFKVDAIVNEINGFDHTGKSHVGMPAIFGMNFQAVSVGQKVVAAGYLDASGTPSAGLQSALDFVDSSLNRMRTALNANFQLFTTLVIISAKHGQSPIDPNHLVRIPADNSGRSPADILGDDVAVSIEDDASLIWLRDQGNTAADAALLSTLSNIGLAGIGEVFAADSLKLRFKDPLSDARTPDIIVQPNIGVVYTGKKKKIAEHGGAAPDDLNVALIVSSSSFPKRTIGTAVATTQIAPTILKALRLNPALLQAVVMEGTQPLPNLDTPD